MVKSEKLTPEKKEELAEKIYKLFKRYGMWCETTIYFNGKCINSRDYKGSYHYDGSVYLHEDKDPRDCFEHVAEDHIISMSFEGPVYHMFNYGERPAVLRRFNELLKKYGVYYEQGNAWNLTCYYG